MNHREPQHRPVAARKAWHCLSLVLLSAMSPARAQAFTRFQPPLPSGHALRRGECIGYLAGLGAVPLRFESAEPATEVVQRVAERPVLVASSPTEPTADSVSAAATTASVSPSAPPPVAPPSETPARKAPPAILPDEGRPNVQPEDFLRFFQIPGSTETPRDVTLIVPVPKSAPAPASIPSSSATYTQTPR